MSNAGQAALGIVGGVVGFFVGGGPMGAVYGFQIGLAIGSVVSPTQLPGTFGPRLQDKRTTTSEMGAPVTELFGRDVVAGTVIWLGDVIETAHTEDVGGKGGPEGSSTTFKYKQSIAIGLCRGPKVAVRRIWENGKIVYQSFLPDGLSPTAALLYLSTMNDYASGFELYQGTETQLPDPTIEQKEGAGNVPGYRGLAYIVYPERALREDQGLRHPSFKFELDTGAGSSPGSGDGFIIPYVIMGTADRVLEPYEPYAITAREGHIDEPVATMFEDTFDSAGIPCRDICGKGGNLLAVGSVSETQYWARVSDDGGVTWSAILIGDTLGAEPTQVRPFSCDVSETGRFIVAGNIQPAGEVYTLQYSDNNGGLWLPCALLDVESDFRYGVVRYLSALNAWFCGGYRGIAKSVDGETWLQVHSQASFGVIDFAYGAITSIAALQAGSIWASTDDGETWAEVYNGGYNQRAIIFGLGKWLRYDAGFFELAEPGFSTATSLSGPWTPLAQPPNWDIYGLTQSGPQFVAGGRNTATGAALIGVSTDGINWEVAAELDLANVLITRVHKTLSEI